MPSNSLNEVSETPAATSFISLSLLLARLIIFPTGINLTSIVLLGTWLNNTCTPKPTSFRWVPGRAGQFCELALVIKGVTAILNEYVLREMTAIGQMQILPLGKWTSEQRD
jgi:hypothetical protein